MADLINHQSGKTTKLLFLGNNGAGKTGALASLADAGYNIRIMDFDNGVDTLAKILGSSKSPYSKDAISRVKYETITDPMKNIGGRLVPKKATVWQRGVKLLDNWETRQPSSIVDGKEVLGAITDSLGPISSWSNNEVLVIDSLTMFCTGALNFILSMNGRLGQKPHQSDWWDGQQLVEGVMQTLFDDGVQCNVIVNCHITFIGDEGQPQIGYPATLGKALSPKIGTYFNSILLAKSQGQGTMAKHKILTKSQGMIELKTSAPYDVPPELPLETGLADYFKIMRGGTPISEAAAASAAK